MTHTRELRVSLAVLVLYLVCMLTSCGGSSSSSSGSSSAMNSSSPSTASPGVPGAAAQQATVVLVMEENHAFEDVIGSSAMPYLNSLARQGAVATQYYANVHHSLPNYLQLTTGAMVTMDDAYMGTISGDNLAHEITASGKSWKSYQEDLPSAGYLGDDVANYIKHHNPFSYFADVAGDPAQTARIVPFSQFAADLNANALPSFSFVVPNRIHDAHNCPGGPLTCSDPDLLGQADQWLQSNIGPLLGNAQFQKNGLLLIVFDESMVTDIRHGGGRVPLIAVGPHAKPGAQSAAVYQHENTLRTVCDLLGLSTCPGAGATAAAETDLVH